MLSSDFHVHCTHTVHTHALRQNSDTHIIKVKKSLNKQTKSSLWFCPNVPAVATQWLTGMLDNLWCHLWSQGVYRCVCHPGSNDSSSETSTQITAFSNCEIKLITTGVLAALAPLAKPEQAELHCPSFEVNETKGSGKCICPHSWSVSKLQGRNQCLWPSTFLTNSEKQVANTPTIPGHLWGQANDGIVNGERERPPKRGQRCWCAEENMVSAGKPWLLLVLELQALLSGPHPGSCPSSLNHARRA